jgi:TonB family protein
MTLTSSSFPRILSCIGFSLAAMNAHAQTVRASAALPPVAVPCSDDEVSAFARSRVDTVATIFRQLLTADATRSCQLSSNELNVIQRGSLRGIAYEIWEGNAAGGRIQGYRATGVWSALNVHALDQDWSLTCSIDRMNDKPRCKLQRGDLTIIKSPAGLFITVGSDHYPGTAISIRLDESAAISAPAGEGFSRQRAALLLGQLKRATTVTTRYQEWPYRAFKDNSFSLFGAAEAIDLLTRAYSVVGKPAKPIFSKVAAADSTNARPAGSTNARPAGSSNARPTEVRSITASGDSVYNENEVDWPVSQMAGFGSPVYPKAMRASGAEGSVVARFVVKPDGTADVGSFIALQATNQAFLDAVRTALPQMRFVPAKKNGRAVNLMVQQRFDFTLAR